MPHSLTLIAFPLGVRSSNWSLVSAIHPAEDLPARVTSRAGGRVSCLFMGEHGEYYGGDCFGLYLGLVQPHELATIVFHNVRKPELNKIAMGFLFHRLIIFGRGVTDLDKQTAEVQTILAETTS
jgi:hypothetical protein